MTSDKETLTAVLWEAGHPVGKAGYSPQKSAEAVLDSEWLKQHDREVTRRALENEARAIKDWAARILQSPGEINGWPIPHRQKWAEGVERAVYLLRTHAIEANPKGS